MYRQALPPARKAVASAHMDPGASKLASNGMAVLAMEGDEEEEPEVAKEALSISMEIIEGKKKKKKIPAGYLTRDATAMRKEIRKHAKKDDDDASAYTSHPKGGWKADYTKGGKRYKTRKSKWTTAYHRKYGEGEEIDEGLIFDDVLLEGVEVQEEVIVEAIKGKTRTALQNKAEDANVPLGVLTTVYRKGLAAWRTGHRPGTSQHQWAMGRVNSFLAGGPARRVDAAQWDRVKDYRKKKRK
jgi:hypothetical protein